MVSTRFPKRILTVLAGCVSSAILFSACATTGERPVSELASARASIEQAERSGAQQHATEALITAREKLAEAEQAAANGRHDAARRKAREAEVDADLAAALALKAKNVDTAWELEEGLRTLEREIARGRTN